MTHLLWLTERSLRHQQQALAAAPDNITVTMLRQPDQATLYRELASADILISERQGAITAEMLQHAPPLKLIVRLGSLAFDIDVDACQSRGILVSRQPLPMTMMVAEHVMMQILVLLKHLNTTQALALNAGHKMTAARTDENTFSYNWHKVTGIQELFGKTVSIIGMGEIGVELSRRLRGFALEKILYHKRRRYPEVVEIDLGLTYATWEDCLRAADVLVTLLPYAAETDRWLNAEKLGLMQPGALLVHAGSGSTLDELAVIDGLQTGQLAGAALDTYEYEPLPAHHPLIAAARRYNVVLTPHVAAGAGGHTRERDYVEVLRYLQHEALRYRII